MAVEEKEMIGVQDATGDVIAEKQLESLKGQLKIFEDTLKSLTEQKQDYYDQCMIDEEAWQIRLKAGNHEKIEDKKSFKYELDPRFWELVRAKQEYEYREHKQKMESSLKGFDRRIAETADSLESVKEKIAALESE